MALQPFARPCPPSLAGAEVGHVATVDVVAVVQVKDFMIQNDLGIPELWAKYSAMSEQIVELKGSTEC